MTKPDQFTELAKSWATLNRAINKMLVTQAGKMTEASEAVEAARARHESLFTLYTHSTLSASMGAPGAAAQPLDTNASRYEHVRQMSPRVFAELCERNLRTGVHFDQLVDEHRAAAAKESEVQAKQPGEHPPLGSMLWLTFFAGAPGKRAQEYVDMKHPVVVFDSTDAGPLQWVVAFKDSDFWADAFNDKASADTYAEAWNANCRATAT